jgi:hypothetical protein
MSGPNTSATGKADSVTAQSSAPHFVKHGRTAKLMGDGMLVEIPIVVDAIRAATKT